MTAIATQASPPLSSHNGKRSLATKIVARALPLVVALILAAPAHSQPSAATPPPKSFDLGAIDAYVAGQVKEKGYVGLSLAIVRDGKIVLAKGYGKSSLKPERSADVETLFAIGSITKQFTCACIFLLAEEGKLTVKDPVANYF